MESPSVEAPLFTLLDQLDIAHKTYRHAPVFTVEEAQQERAHMPPGGHSKNLFIRDKRKNFALVVAHESRRIDLKTLGEAIGMGRPSFARAQQLEEHLGVPPGSVTPFALINTCTEAVAHKTPAITLALDETLMAHKTLYFHPLHNSATTSISPAGLLRLVRALGYQPVMF